MYFLKNTKGNKINCKFNIWLVNTYGYVLIKKDVNVHTVSKISDLTLEASNIKDLIKLIESDWGILCSRKDLKTIYRVTGDSVRIKGKILTLNLNWDQKRLIEERCEGVFVNYQELGEKFGKYINEDLFKEAFFFLISELDNVYGHHNIQALIHVS